MVMLVALMSPAFTSCELDGPVAHFTISVNDRLTYLPQESITEMAALNDDFATTPCEKDDAIKRFNVFCNNLQAYYDENRGKLIWDDLKFEICLYNTTSGKGVGEGEIVASHIISYLCEKG